MFPKKSLNYLHISKLFTTFAKKKQMKTKITFFAILLVAVIGSSCASRRSANVTSNPLIGTWELVSARTVISPDHPFLYKKMFNDTHFSVVTYTREGQVLRIHGGTYTLNGDVYIENIEYSSIPGMPNTTSTFRLEIRGDRKYISGAIVDGRLPLNEVWRRVH